MSYFLKSGNTFRVATKESMDLHEALPVGNYTIKMDPMENFYLEHIEDFDVPKKVYGNVLRQTDRVINTFNKRGKSTGVLMTGEKGSGKTMLSKNICIEMSKQGVPTIVINQPWFGEKFNTLIQSIQQPAIVLFDEFEKVYDREQQEQMLTLLDGVYSTQKLFILTCNDRWRVDTHMRNRPGRIYYYFDFRGLEEEFIREYCQDNLNNKSHIDTICSIAGVFSAFNFDMLKATVEEMNRYDETPQEALKVLNVRAEFDSGTAYDVKIYRGNEEANRISPQQWTGTPLAKDDLQFSYYIQDPNERANSVKGSPAPALVDNELEAMCASVEGENDKEYGWMEIELNPADLVKLDTKTGRFIFEKDGVTVILNRIRERSFNFDAF